MREKLIELLGDMHCGHLGFEGCETCDYRFEDTCHAKAFADHLLANGVIVLPCNVGDTVYRISDDCEFPGDCGTKRMCNGCEYRRLIIEEQTFDLSMLCSNGSLYKGYYLTITEAEAALREVQG